MSELALYQYSQYLLPVFQDGITISTGVTIFLRHCLMINFAS